MRNRLSTVLASLVAGTVFSCHPGDFETIHNLFITEGSSRVEKSEIEAITSVLIHDLVYNHSIPYDLVTRAIKRVHVQFVDEHIPCGDRMCAGILDGDKAWVTFKAHECLPLTSFVHELLHRIGYWIYRDADKEHERESFWQAQWSKGEPFPVELNNVLLTCRLSCEGCEAVEVVYDN